jgi:S1-C subfamily serine protease
MRTHILLGSCLFTILFLQSAVVKVDAENNEQKVQLNIKSTVVKIEFWYKGNWGEKNLGTTSGVVIGSDGEILSSSDVEENITVHFKDGRKVPAQIVKKDKELRLAILKVDLNNLQSVTISKKIPPVGEKVIVAGFEGVDAQSCSTVSGILTSNKYEMPGLNPLYVYSILTYTEIRNFTNILFTERGELLSIVELFNSGSATRQSFFYPLQDIDFIKYLVDIRSIEKKSKETSH